MTLGDVARAIGGTLCGDTGRPATGASFDTRTLRPGDLFFALPGASVDGHRFVEGALRAGASGAVVARGGGGPPGTGTPGTIETDAPRAALGRLAAHLRTGFDGTVVGVTGSNGKTTVKRWLADALGSVAPAFASPKSFNNDLGVPWTILNAPAPTRFLVLEIGTNRPGEIAALSRLARPTAAVLTSVGRAHLERFGSLAGIAREKGDLPRAVPSGGQVWLPDDAPEEVLRDVTARVETVGESARAGWRIEGREATAEGSRFSLRGVRFDLNVPGVHNARNAAMAIASACGLGADLRRLPERVRAWRLPEGRLGVTRGPRGVLVDDSYNANPDSLRAALDVLARMAPPRVAVLGDLGEMGASSGEAHREAGREVAAHRGMSLVGAGPGMGLAVEAACAGGAEARAYVSSAAAAGAIGEWWRPGASWLVKGSRAARMEIVADAIRSRIGGGAAAGGAAASG